MDTSQRSHLGLRKAEFKPTFSGDIETQRKMSIVKSQLSKEFGPRLLVEKDYTGREIIHRVKMSDTCHTNSTIRRRENSPDKLSNERIKAEHANTKVNLMRNLIRHKTSVDDDTILLINASEVLTRDGIHGKIS